MSALVLGALCARGIASCTEDQTVVIPPMGYDQQVCLSIASPIDGNCFELTNPATQTIPVTLELNSTFALRPPGSCSTNALNNCGHAIFYVNGQCATRSAGLLTDISLAHVHDPYGKVTITALLVDDCDTPWTLLWNDAGVVEDGGVMCLPQDGNTGTKAMNACPAGLPPAPPSNVTNTCPENANPDASANQGPYFASVTINVQPTCPGGSTSSTSMSVTSSTGAGTGGASASSSASGTGGASSSSASGMGGASSSTASGTGGASSSSASGTGGASSSASGTGGASTSASSASGMGGASTSSSASGTGGASSSGASGTGGGAADAGDGG